MDDPHEANIRKHTRKEKGTVAEELAKLGKEYNRYSLKSREKEIGFLRRANEISERIGVVSKEAKVVVKQEKEL